MSFSGNGFEIFLRDPRNGKLNRKTIPLGALGVFNGQPIKNSLIPDLKAKVGGWLPLKIASASIGLIFSYNIQPVQVLLQTGSWGDGRQEIFTISHMGRRRSGKSFVRTFIVIFSSKKFQFNILKKTPLH